MPGLKALNIGLSPGPAVSPWEPSHGSQNQQVEEHHLHSRSLCTKGKMESTPVSICACMSRENVAQRGRGTLHSQKEGDLAIFNSVMNLRDSPRKGKSLWRTSCFSLALVFSVWGRVYNDSTPHTPPSSAGDQVACSAGLERCFRKFMWPLKATDAQECPREKTRNPFPQEALLLTSQVLCGLCCVLTPALSSTVAEWTSPSSPFVVS